MFVPIGTLYDWMTRMWLHWTAVLAPEYLVSIAAMFMRHHHSTIQRSNTLLITVIMSSWSRLIRFADDNGRETFGEPVVSDPSEIAGLLEKGELYAVEYKGQTAVSASEKGEKVHVKAVLDLFKPEDVPIVRCIGLNYKEHSKFH